MSKKPMDYLKHIDGVRALAVLLVIFFHFGVGGFSAGYIGVDIFFVISGFVISRLLVNEIDTTNRLDLLAFYKRRIRRIFPALIFTFAITVAGSALLFAPENLVQYGGSLTAAALSVSNVLFWYESGYFDTASHLKPLLHTWSLSVEEQFYLAWPLLLLLLARTRIMLIGIAGLFLISFFLNFYWVKTASPNLSSTLFFLTPFRVFEFALGAGCVFAERKFRSPALVLETQCLLGLALIGFSLFTLNSKSLFPYLNALPVVLGTGLLILSGDSRLARLIFENKLAVGIGLLSYSLYLMHWPVFVFIKYVYVNIAETKYIFSMLAITLMLAIFSYFCIEKPFRKPKTEKRKFWIYRASITIMLAFMVLGLTMKFSEGWAWRYTGEPLSVSAIEQGKSDRYQNLHNACSVLQLDNPAKCHMDRPIQLLVLGNSHEPDGFNMFHYLYGKNPLVNIINFGTVNDCAFKVSETEIFSEVVALNCSVRFAALNDPKFAPKITHIVYSNHKAFEPVAKDLWLIFERLMQRNSAIKLIALGSYLETSVDCSTIRNTQGSFEACKKPEFVTYFKPDERDASPIPQTKTLPYLFISKYRLLCPEMQLSACRTSANGEPMFYDVHHLSFGFARYLGELIASQHKQDLMELGLPSPGGR